jgi:hypothetical protein
MHNACAKAVGRRMVACLQTDRLIHGLLGKADSCAQNVFFSVSFTSIFAMSFHMLSRQIQSVSAELCTLYTGLTITTTNKLYVYKGVCT